MFINNIHNRNFFLIKECSKGWYGLDCKQQCSRHCKDNTTCNHVTGQCDGGCAAGWRGGLCDQGIFLQGGMEMCLIKVNGGYHF